MASCRPRTLEAIGRNEPTKSGPTEKSLRCHAEPEGCLTRCMRQWAIDVVYTD